MRKRIILMVICVLAIMFTFTGCNGISSVDKEYDTESNDNVSMFTCVEDGGTWLIVYHKETKVMYAISNGSYNYGNFTILVNPDGSPMLYDAQPEQTREVIKD